MNTEGMRFHTFNQTSSQTKHIGVKPQFSEPIHYRKAADIDECDFDEVADEFSQCCGINAKDNGDLQQKSSRSCNQMQERFLHVNGSQMSEKPRSESSSIVEIPARVSLARGIWRQVSYTTYSDGCPSDPSQVLQSSDQTTEK